MDDVTSFRIEEGSCLERIESYGLSFLSYQNTNEDARRSILVLPSTVTSIAGNGLYQNNPIKTIYYCSSTHLSNYSDLVNGVNAPDIKVTSSYTYGTIFGNYTPNTTIESIADAEETCKSFGYDLTKNHTSVPVKRWRLVTGWSDGNSHCPPSIDIPVVLDGAPIAVLWLKRLESCLPPAVP